MELYTIPTDIECDNTIRVYKKLNMHGNTRCHFERVPHPDDCMHTSNGSEPTARYYGQWIDMTEDKTIMHDKQQITNNSTNTAKATNNHIDLPITLRAVEPNEIAKFIERNKDKLEIITADSKDK